MAEIKKILYAKNNRTLLLLITTPQEIQTLQGQHKNIILLPTDVKRQRTKIAKRGKKERTTYILIPKNMRQDLTKQKKVEIIRIDTDKNIFFIQTIKKK